MRVFVLSTARCGSQTCERACRHLTNYTAGHETRKDTLAPDRFAVLQADHRWLTLAASCKSIYRGASL